MSEPGPVNVECCFAAGAQRRPGLACRVSRWVVKGVGLSVALSCVWGAAFAGAAWAETVMFASTGAEQTFTVPAGVTLLHVVAVGGRGGAAAGSGYGGPYAGGFGASAVGDTPVVAGQVLYVEVAGDGSPASNGPAAAPGGFNGGGSSGIAPHVAIVAGAGGGGASDVRTVSSSAASSLASRLIIAGGGGGAADEGAGGAPGAAPSPYSLRGGRPGTAAAGGAGGSEPGYPGTGEPGALGTGGAGGAPEAYGGGGGGGGGGGLFGGGGGFGGASTSSGGHFLFLRDGAGGGGSSGFAPGVLNTSTSADTTGVPSVTITYTPPPPLSPPPPQVPNATLASTSVAVSSSGAVVLKVSCPAGETSCAGTITLRTVTAVSASPRRKSKPAVLTLAAGSFTVPGGNIKAVTLRLSKKARALLTRTHVLRARATIVAHDRAGATHTTRTIVTLHAAKAKRKR
jgi:hypothetical protein